MAARVLAAGLCGWASAGQGWGLGATSTVQKVRITQQYVVASGETAHLPYPLRFPSADYPVESMRQGQFGLATVECRVLPDGSVTAIKVTQATAAGFGDAAQTAVAGWQFRPFSAPVGSRPAGVRLVCSFTFELPDED